jgi:catechol 2,3-dioxygenase-like lactoylglutathione lyase family enzyme
MSQTPTIAELGHVGIRCHDIPRQLAFYTDVLGLTVTDHDEALGIWFLSARPSIEHHELRLATGRNARRRRSDPADLVSLRASRGRARLLPAFQGAREQAGHDRVPWRQPFVERIDIETPPEQLLAAIRTSVERFGADGFTEESYRQWTLEHGADKELA